MMVLQISWFAFKGITKDACLKLSSCCQPFCCCSSTLLQVAVGSDLALNTGIKPGVLVCNCRFLSLMWEPPGFVCVCKKLEVSQLRKDCSFPAEACEGVFVWQGVPGDSGYQHTGHGTTWDVTQAVTSVTSWSRAEGKRPWRTSNQQHRHREKRKPQACWVFSRMGNSN